MRQSKSSKRSNSKNKRPSSDLTQKSQIRIIAGQFRGRKLSFQAAQGLRPTLDQVRETVFNWLSAEIHGAKCLDLFAGSGALGFEALSRGAVEVEFVDNNSNAISNIKQNLSLLSAHSSRCINLTAELFIQSSSSKFDLIFVDPPYNLGLIENTLLNLKQHLTEDGLVYIEMESNLTLDFLEPSWEILKLKKTSRLIYGLIKAKS